MRRKGTTYYFRFQTGMLCLCRYTVNNRSQMVTAAAINALLATREVERRTRPRVSLFHQEALKDGGEMSSQGAKKEEDSYLAGISPPLVLLRGEYMRPKLIYYLVKLPERAWIGQSKRPPRPPVQGRSAQPPHHSRLHYDRDITFYAA